MLSDQFQDNIPRKGQSYLNKDSHRTWSDTESASDWIDATAMNRINFLSVLEVDRQ